MKKKIAVILFMVALCLTSAFAASKSTKTIKAKNSKTTYKNYQRGKDMGLGLNLGYPGAGLAVRYHNDDFRVLGAVAFDYLASGLAVDLTGEYIFARIECDEKARNVIDLSAGIGAGVGIPLGGGAFALAFEAGLIANYNIPDIPFSLFLRALYRPTLVFGDSIAFQPVGFAGSLGFTYNFEIQ